MNVPDDACCSPAARPSMSVSKVSMRDYKLSLVVVRELLYERHNRTDWVRVPLVGIHTLIRTDW
jgi:predicted trehalose synthase